MAFEDQSGWCRHRADDTRHRLAAVTVHHEFCTSPVEGAAPIFIAPTSNKFRGGADLVAVVLFCTPLFLTGVFGCLLRIGPSTARNDY